MDVNDQQANARTARVLLMSVSRILSCAYFNASVVASITNDQTAVAITDYI